MDQLISAVCEHFQRNSEWPTYEKLELEFVDDGPLERLLDEVNGEALSIDGSREGRIRFASLKAYANCCGSETEMMRFLQAVDFLANRYVSNPDDAKVSGVEIRDELGLGDLEALRICRLIEEWGSALESGGSRGDVVEQWTFSLKADAMYFKGVTSLSDFSERVSRVREFADRRNRRRRSWPHHPEEADVGPRFPQLAFPDLPDQQLALHPAIANEAAPFFVMGHLNEAVRAAAHRLETFIQDATDDHEHGGQDLVGRALGGDSPRIRLNSGTSLVDHAEQQGFHFLAKGAMAGIRNVLSHGDHPDLTSTEALERLVTLSLLIRRMEKAIGSPPNQPQ